MMAQVRRRELYSPQGNRFANGKKLVKVPLRFAVYSRFVENKALFKIAFNLTKFLILQNEVLMSARGTNKYVETPKAEAPKKESKDSDKGSSATSDARPLRKSGSRFWEGPAGSEATPIAPPAPPTPSAKLPFTCP